MKKTKITAKYKTAKIDIMAEFDDDCDNIEIYYFHPLTNQKCESIDQCFSGWSEQNNEENKNWDILKNKLENFNELETFACDETDIEFDELTGDAN